MSAFLSLLLSAIALVVDIYFKIVLIEIILHWLIYFKIIKLTNRYTQTTMRWIEKLTEPAYARIRKKIPYIANLDFSPVILLFGLYILSMIIYKLHAIVL